MATEEIFKKIYQDLKEEILNQNRDFLKEYVIPSKNYKDENRKLYYANTIELELHQMMKQFDNKIRYMSYKDKYFFSDNIDIVRTRMLLEVRQEIEKNKRKLVER